MAENRELRKKAERLAAVEKERDMLEKQLDDVALERDTNKKDLAEADKTIAALESKLTQKEDAIALVAAKDKEIEKMKEARAKEKIDEANEKMNLRRQSAERAKTKFELVPSHAIPGYDRGVTTGEALVNQAPDTMPRACERVLRTYDVDGKGRG